MENKNKRFYKVKEMVWVIGKKKEGKIVSINKDTLEVEVSIKVGKNPETKELLFELHTLKMWEIDKLKYKAKEKLVSKNPSKPTIVAKGQLTIHETAPSPDLIDILASAHQMMNPEVFVAKTKTSAIVPSKREEDAGYDWYACIDGSENDDVKQYTTFEQREEGFVIEIYCPKSQTTLVPTGIATALPKTHYFNLKHERGSTAVKAMAVLAGVVDSGYRDECFIALTPLNKDIIITNQVTKAEETEDAVLYPYSKAIAQGTVDLVPKTKIIEIDFEALKLIESERGATKLGQSGK